MEREPQDKKLFHRWGEFAFALGTFFIALGVSLMEKGGLGMSMVTSQSYIISLAVPFSHSAWRTTCFKGCCS